MRKGIVVVISILILLVFSSCGIDKDKIVGDILLSHNLDMYTNTDYYMLMYSLSNNKTKKIENGNYLDLCGIEFNKDKTKILGVKSAENRKVKNPFIFEYDIKEETFIKIVEYAELTKGSGGGLQYVPNSNSISYTADNKVYIYDREKTTNSALVDIAFDKYDWDKTGSKILYGDRDDNIYIYDLTNKTSTKILEGRYPVYSNNNKYIAYQGKDYKLTVYDIDTKKEWKSISLSGNQKYIFSPDDKFIALATQYSDISNNPHFEMFVVDYKDNEQQRLFKGDGGIPAFDWK